VAALTYSWPFEELNYYLRTFPKQPEAVPPTLAFGDTIHHAPRITASTQVSVGQGMVGGEVWRRPQVEVLGGPEDTYRLTNKGGIEHG
jgi:hypothetical protein